jgi:hypothetical protein
MNFHQCAEPRGINGLDAGEVKGEPRSIAEQFPRLVPQDIGRTTDDEATGTPQYRDVTQLLHLESKTHAVFLECWRAGSCP